MAKKDFSLLVAVKDGKLRNKLAAALKTIYTVKTAGDLAQLGRAKPEDRYSLLLCDYRLMKGNVKTLEVSLLEAASAIIFLVYSERERKRLAQARSRKRAIDYVIYEANFYALTEKIHKAVRWTILQSEMSGLSVKLTEISRAVEMLTQKVNLIRKEA